MAPEFEEKLLPMAALDIAETRTSQAAVIASRHGMQRPYSPRFHRKLRQRGSGEESTHGCERIDQQVEGEPISLAFNADETANLVDREDERN